MKSGGWFAGRKSVLDGDSAQETAFDRLKRLIALLPEGELRHIAAMRLAGHSSQEISEATRRSIPSVYRKLLVIQEIWHDKQMGS